MANYNKILLMEFIIQDMLLFYVEPLKGRMLRSELVSVRAPAPSSWRSSFRGGPTGSWATGTWSSPTA